MLLASVVRGDWEGDQLGKTPKEFKETQKEEKAKRTQKEEKAASYAYWTPSFALSSADYGEKLEILLAESSKTEKSSRGKLKVSSRQPLNCNS